MLKTFKHYAKQACLVFAILVSTVSCEKEEIVPPEANTQNTSQESQFKLLVLINLKFN